MPTFLDGYKTYIGALGFIGLGIYQMTQGDYQNGIANISAGFGFGGARHAIEKLKG